MAYVPRLHLDGGFYYVSLERPDDFPPLFSTDDEFKLFETYLAETLELCGARLHGYFLGTRVVRLVLEVGDVPLYEFMRLVMAKYVHRVRFKRHLNGPRPAPRYQTTLFEADGYLHRFLRLVSWGPALYCCVGGPEGYERSSHRAYLGLRHTSWLTTQTALQMFARGSTVALRRYQEFMQQRPDAGEVAELTTAAALNRNVLGSAIFLAKLPRKWVRPRKRMTLETVIERVCKQFEVEPAELYREGRSPKLITKIRSVVDWYAFEKGVALHAEVAQHFGKSRATLQDTTRRYQEKYPDLFDLAAYEPTRPIVSARIVAQLEAHPARFSAGAPEHTAIPRQPPRLARAS